MLGAVVALVVVLRPGLSHLTDARPPSPSAGTEPSPAPTGARAPSAETSATPVPEVGVSRCGTTPPAVRPAQVVVVCDTRRRPVVVSEVTWSSWSQLAATGTAVVTTNDCAPTCADGFERSSAATVVLDQVVTTRGGTQFSRATLVWGPDPPEGFRDPFQSGLPVFSG